MKSIPVVEDAKAVMHEGVEWSVIKWLANKKRVRKMADVANAALDKANADFKAQWSSDLRHAYEAVTSKSANGVDPQLLAFAKKVKHADDQAKAARDKAEKTFDDAEKELSTRMARQGAREAIESWELHEKALKLAEEGVQVGAIK